MRLTTCKPKLTTPMNVPGLIKGGVDYEIKSGTAKIEWTGPKIGPVVWNAVLAFFKDTYIRTKAECQVRLYVNTKTGEWSAWAYPQEARHSMAIKEIENHADRKTQREQFKESEGWQYIGTAHHHCNGGAFQSGTDLNNEKDQDGLHITIGNLESAQYSFHARFYFDGLEFNPDMAAFWDIGNIARQVLPAETHDLIARHQMTAPAPADTEYPKQWTDNVIEVKAAVGGVGFQNGSVNDRPHSYVPVTGLNTTYKPTEWDGIPEMKRKEYALARVRMLMREMNPVPTEEQQALVLEVLTKHPIVQTIRQVAIAYRLTFFDVVGEWEWDVDLKNSMGEAYGDNARGMD